MRHYCQAWVDNDIIEGRKAEMYIVGTYIWKPSGDEVDLWTKDISPVGTLETKWCKIRWNTGLKDKNGVEIYFDDLVRDNDGLVYKVKYGGYFSKDGAGWGVHYYRCIPDTFAMDASPFRHELGLELIGNIYENPELL